jgi:hypothetical protein
MHIFGTGNLSVPETTLTGFSHYRVSKRKKSSSIRNMLFPETLLSAALWRSSGYIKQKKYRGRV